MSEQIADEHWTYHGIDELKEKFSDWLDDIVDHLGDEREVSGKVDDGKLHFKIHDVVLTHPCELSVLIEKNKSMSAN